ncbi:hypothetical protein AGMMS49545_02910 [Betaproteobacteria bacterium]|nr:hypothetical protein AGMMS49545_02910 [Betaproteobacteria bacterium]GHU47430.1 hypothetical protein AGMMS50289_22610 [Betaproteobacteria bacterium]
MRPSNKMRILLSAIFLFFSLAACNEEESKIVSDVHGNASVSRNELDDNAGEMDEKNNNPDVILNKDCRAQDIDPNSVHITGRTVYAQMPGSSECPDQEIIASTSGSGHDYLLEAKVRNIGESETTGEVLVRENELSVKDGNSYGQFGGDWPNNEFSREFLRLLPKPDMAFSSLSLSLGVEGFSIVFKKDVTPDQIKDYVEQVKKRGFTINAKTQDEPSRKFFSYEAKNREGYSVDIICIGPCVLGLKKKEVN